MSASMTPKQERFCLAYIETGNASEAYRRAYNAGSMKPATVNRKAAELLDNGKVTARLAELRLPAIVSAQMTLEGHLADLKAIRDKAVAGENYSAAVAAEVSRGKASGFYTEKLKLIDERELMSDDDLRQEFASVLKRLGIDTGESEALH